MIHSQVEENTDVSLRQMIDERLLQIICESIARIAGISCVVMKRETNDRMRRLIVPSNYSVLCGGDRELHPNGQKTCFREVPCNDTNLPICERSDRGDEKKRSQIINSTMGFFKPIINEGNPGYWEIYRCHAGIVDLRVPILFNNREIAQFAGGQVILNADDLIYVKEKIENEYKITPIHSIDDLMTGFRMNRTRDIKDLVAAAQLLAYIANTITYLYEIDNKKLEFNIGNLRRILAHSIKQAFISRFMDIPDTNLNNVNIKTRLYLLDRNTNQFCWTTNLTNKNKKPAYVNPASPPLEDGKAECQWSATECKQVHELLWRVFREKSTLWATSIDGFQGRALGCYLPVSKEEGYTKGAIQVIFENIRQDDLLKIALHQDESLKRTADLGAQVLSKCLEAEESIRILADELYLQVWTTKAIDNVLQIRQDMTEVGTSFSMGRFWYLFLLALTHHDCFAYNRAGIYVISRYIVGVNNETFYINQAYGIGDLTRRAWEGKVNPAPASLSELRKCIINGDYDPGMEDCGSTLITSQAKKVEINFKPMIFARTSFNRFDMEWMRPTPELIDLLYTRILAPYEERNIATPSMPFKYDEGYNRNKRLEEKLYAGRCQNYSLYLLDVRTVPGGKEYTILYLDDPWTILPDPTVNHRLEELKALNNARLMPRFLDQTRVMVEIINSSRNAEKAFFHNVAGWVGDIYSHWNEFYRPSNDKKKVESDSISLFLRFIRGMSARYSRAISQGSFPQAKVDLCDLVEKIHLMCELSSSELKLPDVKIEADTVGELLEFSLLELICNAKRYGKFKRLALEKCDGASQYDWEIMVENYYRIPDEILNLIRRPGVQESHQPGNGNGVGLVAEWCKKIDLEFCIQNKPDLNGEYIVCASIKKHKKNI